MQSLTDKLNWYIFSESPILDPEHAQGCIEYASLEANCVHAPLSAVDAEPGGCFAKSSEYMSAGFAARALPGGGCGVLTGGVSAAAFDGAAKSRS